MSSALPHAQRALCSAACVRAARCEAMHAGACAGVLCSLKRAWGLRSRAARQRGLSCMGQRAVVAVCAAPALPACLLTACSCLFGMWHTPGRSVRGTNATIARFNHQNARVQMTADFAPAIEQFKQSGELAWKPSKGDLKGDS